jgi:hypothetical protein
MSREDRFAFGAIALVALAVFGPALLRGEVFTLRDHADYFQPLRAFTADDLRALRLPLWNPYNASGEPWLANPQTGVFYPPAWLFVLLPFATAYVSYLLIHALLLGVGAYLFFSRDASRPAALVGAVALMLSGPVLSLIDVQNNFTTFAWVPLVLWRAFRDREDPSPRAAAVLLALAFLAGEPFFAACAAVLYALVVRRPRVIAVAGVFAAGLSAIQLFPFLETLRGSDRMGGFAAADILRDSMRWRDWLRIAVPPGGVLDPHLSQHFLPVVYAGIVVVILALAGALVRLRERRWHALAFWFAVAAVASGPPLLARLPLTLFRYPARLVPFGILAIAALAVAGWEAARGAVRARLGDGRGHRAHWVDALVVLAIAADLLAAAQPLLRSGTYPVIRVPYERTIGRDAKILRASGPLLVRGARRDLWIAGYTNLFDRRFDASTAAPVVSRVYSSLYDRALGDFSILQRISCGYVIAARPLPPRFAPIETRGIVSLYRVIGALPLAYVRGRDGTLQNVGALAFDTAHARVTVETAKGGVLVLTQNDAPGWRVTIDGAPARKLRELGTLRAVEVAAGVHRVEWSYRPLSLVSGALVTLCAIVAIAFARRRV